MDPLASLNPDQRIAVETIEGPVCIIAGPGTGKTKTLVSRLSYMIQEHAINPSAILAVTFTRKAAAEMRERLSTLLPHGTLLPLITTFHGLGHRLLAAADTRSMRIIDDAVRTDIISGLITERFPNLSRLPLREVLLRISRYKNMIADEDDSLLPLVNAYREELVREGIMDYDDLLLETYRKMESDEDFSRRAKKLCSHILIDEFQDTNPLQYAIIQRMLNQSDNLFVIGDPQQSIYSFRGANETIFDILLHDFPFCKRITLTINYRSTPEVLSAGCSLFPDRTLTATVEQRGSVTCIRTLNEYTEADWIIGEIGRKMGGIDLLQAHSVNGLEDKAAGFSDFAVLYRTHTVAKTLAKRFEESGIPFQAVGALTPYEQPEIACIIAMLEYVDDPTREHLLHVYAQRRMKIPKATLKELIDGRQVRRGKKIVETVTRNLTELTALSDRPISHLVAIIVERFDLKKYIDMNTDMAMAYRQFCANIVRFDSMKDGLNQFTSYISQIREHEYYDPRADRVALLTIHAAKGLEFPYVFICGFEDGLIPLIRDSEPSDEEKRLLFVAMTRAKKELYLTETKMRARHSTTPSRFKGMISAHLSDREDDASVHVEKRNEIRRLKKSQMSLF